MPERAHALLTFLRRTFHDRNARSYRVVEIGVALLIFVSIGLTVVELTTTVSPEASAWLAQLDRAILGVFAIEILLRIALYQPPDLQLFHRGTTTRLRSHILGRLRYCIQPMTFIDLATLLALHPALRGLRALRVFRLARGVRLFKYANPFSQLAGAFQDNAMLYVFAFGVLGAETVVGGVTMYLIEHENNPAVSTVWDGMWWTLVTLTTVGYGDITPVDDLGRAWAGLLMVAGMFTLALFAGVVGHTMLHTVLTIREEQFRMSRNADHVVVIGYHAASRMLLDALLTELGATDIDVVLFGPGERPSDVPAEVRWISGDPAKESELDKVHLTHARTLIFVGARDTLPQQADASTVLGIFTARAYLRHHAERFPRKKPLHIVAEILEPENVEHARVAGANEVIESSRLGFALLAHTIAHPGTAELMGRVVSAGANSVYVVAPGPLAGHTFKHLASVLKQEHQALLLGVRTGPVGIERLNPPDDLPITPDLQLIYLAKAPIRALRGEAPRTSGPS